MILKIEFQKGRKYIFMKRKKNYGAIICAAALLFTGINAYAATGQHVEAKITSDETSAQSKNAIWNCQDNLELDGENKSSSTNALYVQCYEQRNSSVDRKEREMLLEVGNSDIDIWTLSAYNSGKAYYVKLNPKGALKKGCNGSGALYD